MLASSEIGVLHLDLDSKIRLFTPPIKRLVSLEQSDIGVPIEKFHLQWNYPDFLRDIHQVVKTGISIEREVSSEQPGIVYLVQVHPYRNMQLIDGILINVVDVSELKRVERSLKASEQNQRRTLDNLPSVIFKIDIQGEINYLNKAIGGYNRSKMLGANIKDFLIETDTTVFEQKLQEAIESKQRLEFLTTSIALDNSELSLHNSLVPLVQSNGQIQELLLVCRTYAGEKVVSKDEFDRLTRLGAVLSERYIFVSVKDRDFSYQFVNLPFANFLQKPIPSIFQNNDFGIFPGKVAEALRYRDEQVLKNKEPLTTIDQYQLGENRLQLLNHRFLLKEEGEEIKIAQVGIQLKDDLLLGSEKQIESQKELESIVADRTEALVQANQELRTITRSMAHDLRTPLRAIQSYGELLHDTLEIKLDAQENDYFHKIRRQANRMTQIIDGLISYVKLGGIQVNKEHLDPLAIAQAAWEDFKHLLNGTEGEVIFHQCPAIWGDRILTQQIISNLFSNSIKYRKPDEKLE
ncbi:MAG: PAS domain-containing protein, partial [Bacteroidota bacterium]